MYELREMHLGAPRPESTGSLAELHDAYETETGSLIAVPGTPWTAWAVDSLRPWPDPLSGRLPLVRPLETIDRGDHRYCQIGEAGQLESGLLDQVRR